MFKRLTFELPEPKTDYNYAELHASIKENVTASKQQHQKINVAFYS
jgi:hypothetical protein